MTTLVVLRIVAFVLPLGLDTLAIAIALGLRGLSPWRPALIFAIFEGIMPVFGIVLARIVSLRFEIAAVVVGGMILIGIGFNMIREATLGEEGAEGLSFSSFRASLAAGLAISTDELAVGFPLGASGLPITTVLIATAAQALFVTALGIARQGIAWVRLLDVALRATPAWRRASHFRLLVCGSFLKQSWSDSALNAARPRDCAAVLVAAVAVTSL